MNAKAAKPVEKGGKSEAIIELLDKGTTSNNEIIAELAKKGISVSSNYVSLTKKGHLGGGKTRKKSKGTEPSFSAVMTAVEMNGGIKGIENAIKAVESAAISQQIIDQLGGMENAKSVVAALKK